MSLMYTAKRNGDRKDPWGTLDCAGCGVETELSSRTLKLLSEKKERRMQTSCKGTLSLLSLVNRPWCHTLSNAFSKSRKAVGVRSFLIAPSTRLSIRPVNWRDVEWPYLNANCSGLIAWFTAFFSRFKIRISNIFAREFRREIGLRLVGFGCFFLV